MFPPIPPFHTLWNTLIRGTARSSPNAQQRGQALTVRVLILVHAGQIPAGRACVGVAQAITNQRGRRAERFHRGRERMPRGMYFCPPPPLYANVADAPR